MSHFNEVANNWDTEEKIERVTKQAQGIKNKINLESNLDILDFGCGTGLLGFEFINNAKTLLGIDTSDGMLDVFNLKTKDFPNVQSSSINLENENLDRKFDLIVSAMTFHHLYNPENVLMKFSKMLNKNGKIAVIDLESEDGSFHPDNEGMGVQHFGFSENTLISWAKKCNLDIEVSVLDKIKKNNKEYNLFLAIFK